MPGNLASYRTRLFRLRIALMSSATAIRSASLRPATTLSTQLRCRRSSFANSACHALLTSANVARLSSGFGRYSTSPFSTSRSVYPLDALARQAHPPCSLGYCPRFGPLAERRQYTPLRATYTGAIGQVLCGIDKTAVKPETLTHQVIQGGAFGQEFGHTQLKD